MEKKFRIFSILFLLGCVIFYGTRFGYYYYKYNKKDNKEETVEVIANTIQKQGIVGEGDGLYNINGEFIYKGKNVNNYIMYSNMLFRIVRVNTDNTVVLVTDSKLTDLAWSNSTDYSKSYINDWLNKGLDNTGIFESKLNEKEKYLVKNSICTDNISDIKNITCTNKDNHYVSLLGLQEYLNSKNTDTYINNTDTMWLNNSLDLNKVWFIKNGNLSNDTVNKMYGVKALITLNKDLSIKSGKGTKENPYIIEEKDNKVKINSYVKLGNDLYTVYENDKEIRLVMNSLVNDVIGRSTNYYNKEFNPLLQSSIAYYLNNNYYNSLTYKDSLIECEYNVGDYSKTTSYDYKNIYSKKVKAKVGLLSIADININEELKDYFLLNRYDYKIYSVQNKVQPVYSLNKIRPTVCLDKNTKFEGDGTINNPFKLGV